MSEKRFYLDEEDRLCIHYNDRIVACVGYSETEAEKIVGLLNKQQSAIEELIITIKLYETDIIEKDNKIKQLQQQLDFIQNNISNAINHQKTELEQKALKRVISDYNDWLLGHNGEYE